MADRTDAFAAAAVAVMADPRSAQEQAERGRDRVVAEYDWGGLSDRLGVCGRRPAGPVAATHVSPLLNALPSGRMIASPTPAVEVSPWPSPAAPRGRRSPSPAGRR